MSETRIIREQQAASRAAAQRISAFPEDGTVAVLAQTQTVTSYPTVPASFYACVPLWIDGPETEGATASFTVDNGRTLYAFNIGTQVPPVGTTIIAHSCGGRWTFRYDG
jgi:hypothetical protein